MPYTLLHTYSSIYDIYGIFYTCLHSSAPLYLYKFIYYYGHIPIYPYILSRHLPIYVQILLRPYSYTFLHTSTFICVYVCARTLFQIH